MIKMTIELENEVHLDGRRQLKSLAAAVLGQAAKDYKEMRFRPSRKMTPYERRAAMGEIEDLFSGPSLWSDILGITPTVEGLKRWE